jgi:hypothetical protein
VQDLRPAHLGFFDFQADRADRLWSIKRQDEPLFPRQGGDPAAGPWSSALIKSPVDGGGCGLRSPTLSRSPPSLSRRTGGHWLSEVP